MNIHVLLVEDDAADRGQLERDLPSIFAERGVTAKLDVKDTFEDGLAAANDFSVRYDLVISDTYRGPHNNQDAAVLEMVQKYRSGKFCPLIVISSAIKPEDLESTAFVKWASKANSGELDTAISELLQLGIPQLARSLHDLIDASAGNFLWKFVEENWSELAEDAKSDPMLLERIIRRRASLMLSDLIPSQYQAVESKYGLEYYIYPALDHEYFSLGDILQCKVNPIEFRIVMTPHCYLFKQPDQDKPRADYILTIRTVLATDLIGAKLENAASSGENIQHNKIRKWANSPAKEVGKPDGRHWYLPKFLEIPDMFCDFLRLESIAYEDLDEGYRSIATLVPPYAEAMQSCFLNFYGSVGIPNINPVSATGMFREFLTDSNPEASEAIASGKTVVSSANKVEPVVEKVKAKKKSPPE